MAKSPTGAAEGAIEGAAWDRPPLTALLVEDEILIRMDIGEELRRAGWTVYEAGSADAAIEFLRSPMIVDLVLTDVRMPGTKDGIQLAAFVRRERPAIRVAVMSGHYVPNWQEHNLFDDFFRKPLDTGLVVKQLTDLVKGTEPPDSRSLPDEASPTSSGHDPHSRR
jgi:DNA-binding NtrC family response regulator